MRKRVIGICICLAFALLLGIGAYQAKIIKTPEVTSDLYSQEEITDAINVVKQEMNMNWQGLHQLCHHVADPRAGATDRPSVPRFRLLSQRSK